MSARDRCEETRALVGEVALGIADGEVRARVLEHAAACSECRRELERLATVGDEMLVLGPEHEPPPGFELRVLGALQPRRSRRRWIPRALPVAAALAAAALTAGGLLLAFRDDRQLAGHYRATLAQAHGTYFGAVRLHDAAGTAAGAVFAYRGSPSWIVVTVAPAHRASVARAELVTRAGRRIPVAGFRLVRGAWGGALSIDLPALAAVHLIGPAGRLELVASLPGGQ
jgi:Putative zinc-finger